MRIRSRTLLGTVGKVLWTKHSEEGTWNCPCSLMERARLGVRPTQRRAELRDKKPEMFLMMEFELLDPTVFCQPC